MNKSSVSAYVPSLLSVLCTVDHYSSLMLQYNVVLAEHA